MAQTQIFRGRARAIKTNSAGEREYIYHSTAVVTVRPDGSIVLQDGGWQTVTTKLSMNQASHQDRLGFSVSQRDFDWYVTWKGEEVPYHNGIVLN